MNIDEVREEFDKLLIRINSGEEKYLFVIGICNDYIIDTVVYGPGNALDVEETLSMLSKYKDRAVIN